MIDVPQLYADDAGNTYVVVIFQWEIYLGLPPEKKKEREPSIVSTGNSFGIFIQKIGADQSIKSTKVMKIGDRDRAVQFIISFLMSH